MKPDEAAFAQWLLAEHEASYRRKPRTWPREYAMHARRKAVILQKWARRGWYDYGTVVDMGWLTPEGKDALRAALNAQPAQGVSDGSTAVERTE